MTSPSGEARAEVALPDSQLSGSHLSKLRPAAVGRLAAIGCQPRNLIVTCKECREAMVTDPLLNRLRCADCRCLRWSVFRKRAVRVGWIATGALMAFLLAFHRHRRMCRQKHTSIRGGACTVRPDGFVSRV